MELYKLVGFKREVWDFADRQTGAQKHIEGYRLYFIRDLDPDFDDGGKGLLTEALFASDDKLKNINLDEWLNQAVNVRYNRYNKFQGMTLYQAK